MAERDEMLTIKGYKISPELFNTGYPCGVGPWVCPMTCCARGAYVDLGERDRILEHADEILRRKRLVAEWYNEELAGLPLTPHREFEAMRHSWWMYSILARDLGSLGIRVLAIAPSLFATGLMEGAPEDVIVTLTKDAAFPRRPGRPEEFAWLAEAIVRNPMLNGQTIRLDGGQRFAPR